MKNVLLVYNPASGQKRARRAEQIARIEEVFRSAGIQTETCATTHRGSAVEQTRQAVAAGFDTIIACGGDGTANEALNGIMPNPQGVALGVVPLGSGNLLAADLRLPSDPLTAARALLTCKPREIQPGAITSMGHGGPERRYFLVAAGVGADAELMYRTAVESKERFGRNAYFLEMARMTLRGSYPMFQVEWDDDRQVRHTDKISLVMAIRARRFPGLLSLVDLGSALTRSDFTLMLFRTDKVRHFLNFFASVASGLNWKVPQVDVVRSRWVKCTALGAEAIHCQADGELLGAVPAELGMAEQRFRLLMPE